MHQGRPNAVPAWEAHPGCREDLVDPHHILAGYIFGNNRAQEKMAMTAPVSRRSTTGNGEKMQMTAPVTQRPQGGASADTFVLSFVMPSRYTLDTLPEPLDPQVRLREAPQLCGERLLVAASRQAASR